MTKITYEIKKSNKEHKVYGKVIMIKFADGSKVYISKKGWSLVTPIMSGEKLKEAKRRLNKNKKMEIRLPWVEVNAVLNEVIKSEYNKGGLNNGRKI